MKKAGRMTVWRLASAILLTFALLGQKVAWAESPPAKLRIKAVSSLNFGEGGQGDGPRLIASGSSENSENASFEITGQPNRSFSIILPRDNVVRMRRGPGILPTRRIGVNHFTSQPSGSGVLDSQGKAYLYVGATRNALLLNQQIGKYSGNFSGTVVY